MNQSLNIKGNRGTTMIEILVTVIVFSIGLLGIIGMQTVGLRNNTTAYNRSQATILAYDIADRARANPLGAAYYDFTSTTPSEQTSCASTSGCSNQNMAKNDGYEWLQSLAQGLPDGKGIVCVDSTPTTPTVGTPAAPECDGIVPAGTTKVYTVKVWWDEKKDGNPSNYKMFHTDFKI